jgi:MoxR-like ATPase
VQHVQHHQEETIKVHAAARAAQHEDFSKIVQGHQERFEQIRAELSKVIVGQHHIIDNLIEALVANGHVLVEGLPGIAKTLTVRSLARVTGCDFKRIQFTPDLLPTDIIGITAYEEGKGFYTIKGPIFSHFVLADEINRAPPKVQSALLESMQEKQVTIGNQTFPLPQPFFVMATQNPVENLGTYPLPEAQVDRFLYKIIMGYLEPEEEIEIMHKNMTLNKFEDFNLQPVLSPEMILEVQRDVKGVYLDPKVEKYIVRIIDATRHPDKYKIERGKYVEFGGSPRSTISLFIAAKAHALVQGRAYVTPQDVKNKAKDVLRHRLILNYEGQAEDISTDDVIDEILQKVPVVER